MFILNYQVPPKIKQLHYLAWTGNESDQGDSGLVMSFSNP